MNVALKLCNPEMTYAGCNLMREELYNTSVFSGLNDRKILNEIKLYVGSKSYTINYNILDQLEQ